MKGRRKHIPLDCEWLLYDIQRENTIPENTDSKPTIEQQVVSDEARLRESKLSNVKLKYVYSKSEGILHDRSCEEIKNIPDAEFEMSEDLIEGMPICDQCKRKALIRRGIGDDRKSLNLYVRYFEEDFFSDGMLKTIFIDNSAQARLIDLSMMEFKIKDDRWRIQKKTAKCILYHNNYLTLENGDRYFQDDFHKQRKQAINYNQAVKLMTTYSWDDHVIQRQKQAEKKRIAAILSRLSLIENCVRLQKRSLFYSHYAYIDKANYQADEIFIAHKLRVYFGIEYSKLNSDYRIITCKVKKKNSSIFEACMEELRKTLMLQDDVEYEDNCKIFSDYAKSKEEM